MARKQIAKMGLDPAAVRIFAARKLYTAKDALGMTEMELMELLDMPLDSFDSALARINESASAPCRTLLSILKERSENEIGMGHLPTRLKLLDDALYGGIPFGVITELVGPPGIGKTQLCLALSIQTVIPAGFGGLEANVVFIDTERKFSASRMAQMGRYMCPDIFHDELKLQQVANKIIILTPTSATELLKSLQNLQALIIEQGVKLLVIDSVATLLEGNNEDSMIERRELLGKQASLLKYLAESFRLPVVVTNHVRVSGLFEGDHAREITEEEPEFMAALGTAWAHAVNIRLVLEARDGRRIIRVAKCPLSPSVAIPFMITNSGLELDGNEVLQVNEQDVMSIYRSYDLDGDEEIIPINW